MTIDWNVPNVPPVRPEHRMTTMAEGEPSRPNDGLTISALRAAAQLAKDAAWPPRRILVSGHIKSDGRVSIIDQTKMPFPIAWDIMIGISDFITLARHMRAEGARAVRIWKRHGAALYEFR